MTRPYGKGESMAKIAVIGICGNSTFLQVERFHEPGQTLAAEGCFQEIGGKGINQAIAAARMGAQVSFLGAVGEDGDFCEKAIKKEGITPFLAKKNGEITTFAFILTDANGENRVTVYRGAALTEEDVAVYEPEIAKSDILLLQNEVPEKVNAKAIEIAHRHGVKVILNPAPARKGEGKVFLVTPNEQEKAGLGDLQFDHCVTTLGERGCSIDDAIFIPAEKVTAVDTTGAGDTFNGVLACCLAEGMALEKACRYAGHAASISVTRRGVLDAIPYRKEIGL